MQRILVINGHPNEASFNFQIAQAYRKGVQENGDYVELINISQLKFSSNLRYGYQRRSELEPDLLDAFQKIKWAEHIVWVYPQWWGFMPAKLKGFIDRLFLPGLTFEMKDGSAKWEKLLRGKTAHIIHTLDYPIAYYRWVLGAPGIKVMKKQILGFVGIKTTAITYLGPIKNSNLRLRKRWIDKVHHLGRLKK